jgi:hypothetical protein
MEILSKSRKKTAVQVRNEIIRFLNLEMPQRVAIIADSDEDGITSAVQMKKFLDSQKHISEVFFYDHYADWNSGVANELSAFSPQKTIFLDLADDVVSGILAGAGSYTGKFVTLDHHQRRQIKNNKFDFIFFKPDDFSEVETSRYPISKVVHDLFGGVDWICAIGIIGDYAFVQWKDFLEKVQKKYSISFEDLSDLAGFVAATELMHTERKPELFSLLCSAGSPKEIFDSEMFNIKKEYDGEMKKLMRKYKENSVSLVSLDLVFFEADKRLSSKFINILSGADPHTTFVIYEKPDVEYKASFRRGDFRVNCAELARFSVSESENGRGGGHIPAAGATFSPDYLEEFEGRVKQFLRENYKK